MNTVTDRPRRNSNTCWRCDQPIKKVKTGWIHVETGNEHCELLAEPIRFAPSCAMCTHTKVCSAHSSVKRGINEAFPIAEDRPFEAVDLARICKFYILDLTLLNGASSER